MTNRVVHIPSSTHEAFKASCRANGFRMRDVADRLILNWIATTAPKPVRPTPPPESPEIGTVDAYMRPPFWAGRNGS